MVKKEIRRMRTEDKYKKTGFIVLSKGKVQDFRGQIYYPKKAKTLLRSIKLFCKECMDMERSEPVTHENIELVRECHNPMCPLFDFRMGKNPFAQRTLTEKEKDVARTRFASALEAYKT